MKPDTATEIRAFTLVLGQVLAVLRKRAGLGQGDVARAAGIGQSSMSRYENGDALPDAYVLRKVAEALGVTVSHLFEIVDRATALAVQTTGEIPTHGGLASFAAERVIQGDGQGLRVTPRRCVRLRAVPGLCFEVDNIGTRPDGRLWLRPAFVAVGADPRDVEPWPEDP
jgi:transcriptional regulator with XRE-family HTH domain